VKLAVPDFFSKFPCVRVDQWQTKCTAPARHVIAHFEVHFTSFLQTRARGSVVYTSQNTITFCTNRDILYTHYEHLGYDVALQKERKSKR
jgi:hypothetical protein